MHNKLLVIFIFLLSTGLMIVLILKKPQIKLKAKKREIKIDTFFMGALLGLVLILLLGLLNADQIQKGLFGDGYFSPLGVLILFFSMVFISIYLDTTGFFEYCARIALKFAGTSGKRLFFSMYMMVSVLTIFTSNDIVILTFTPFIYYFAKTAEVDPKPYLISEFFAANTWSMALYIGNPTNILLASAFSVKFDEYLKWMLLPTLAAGVTSVVLLFLIFRKQIDVSIKVPENNIPKEALTDKLGAIIGLMILGSCIIILSIAPYLGIEMWIVAFIFALGLFIILLVRDIFKILTKKYKNNEASNKMGNLTSLTMKRIPWGILPFVLSLFIIVEALNVYGITGTIGELFGVVCESSIVGTIFLFGFASAFSANFLNNIPMSVAFIPIIQGVSQEHAKAAMYATIIGSNLGANITLIGALAGIMWMNILRDKNYHLSFWTFLKYGLLITPLVLFSCLGVLSIEFLLFSQ